MQIRLLCILYVLGKLLCQTFNSKCFCKETPSILSVYKLNFYILDWLQWNKARLELLCDLELNRGFSQMTFILSFCSP